MESFTTENCQKLATTCNNIEKVIKENVDGKLIYTQLVFLGELIKDFVSNPIVYTSGIIQRVMNQILMSATKL